MGFNPWWFSGQADLTEKFLAQLGAEIGDESTFSDVRANLAKLSSALSHVPFKSFTGVPVGQAFVAAQSVLEQEEESVEELKEEISAILDDSDRKIVVIIDDIDRLSPAEITQMLQVVKNVGDFPNICYILAFDPDIVSPAVENVQSVQNGREYLRKIVHLPLSIPLQKQNSLRHLFTQYITNIPGDFVYDTERWQDLIENGVMPILETPRDVTRLGNTIDVMYTALGNEVNFVDMVGLETLRVFYDDIYENIRSAPDRYAGRHISFGHSSNDDPEDYSDLFSDDEGNSIPDDEREAVESILKNLFPKVRDRMNDSSTSSVDWSKMRAARRICHDDRFPIYFRLTISEGQIPLSEVGDAFSLIGNPDEFSRRIGVMLEKDNPQHGTKASAFITHLGDRTDRIDPADAGGVIQSILETGDQIIKESNQSPPFYYDEAHYLARIVEELLEKQDGDDAIEGLISAISEGESPYLAYMIVRRLLGEHEEYGYDQNTSRKKIFELSEIEQVKSVMIREIAEAANDGRLLEMPAIVRPLSWWSEWDDSAEANEWVKELAEDDEGLLRFIDAMSRTTLSGGDTPKYYLDPREIGEYIDRNTVESRIEEMDEDNLTEEQIKIIERYREGEDVLDDDLDASSVEAWFMTRRD